MVDEQLLPPLKERGERDGGPTWASENVWFCHLDHGKGADLCGEQVGCARVLFFGGEEGGAGCEPLRWGYDLPFGRVRRGFVGSGMACGYTIGLKKGADRTLPGILILRRQGFDLCDWRFINTQLIQ